MNLYRLEIPLGIFYKPVDTSTTGTIVVGVAGKRIVVISASIIVSANVTLQWQTSTGLAELTGPQAISPTGGYILPANFGGWFQTAFGDSLVLNLNPNTQIGGCISYVLDGP
jgi:hypothetical protein